MILYTPVPMDMVFPVRQPEHVLSLIHISEPTRH